MNHDELGILSVSNNAVTVYERDTIVVITHQPTAGPVRTIASEVEIADTFLRKAVGLIGRTSIAPDYALVFPFETDTTRWIHTVGVRTAIDVIWVADEHVTRIETLPAWRGVAKARADTIIECAPNTTSEITTGDRLVVTDG